MDYVIHNKTALAFREWVKDTWFPDETFFSSISNSPRLGVPGSFTGEVIHNLTTYTQLHVHTHIHTHLYTYTPTYVLYIRPTHILHTYIHTYIQSVIQYTYTCTYIHTYIHIHNQSYSIHTCIRTYTQHSRTHVRTWRIQGV